MTGAPTLTQQVLVARVQASDHDEESAIRDTIAFLEKWVPKGKSPICGNSIGQDRRFLYKHMPELEEYFHYRYVDVSTIKELTRRWNLRCLTALLNKVRT